MCGPGELEALEFYARTEAILVPHSDHPYQEVKQQQQRPRSFPLGLSGPALAPLGVEISEEG